MVQLKNYQDKRVDGIILAEETAVGFYPYHAIDVVNGFKKKKIKVDYSVEEMGSWKVDKNWYKKEI